MHHNKIFFSQTQRYFSVKKISVAHFCGIESSKKKSVFIQNPRNFLKRFKCIFKMMKNKIRKNYIERIISKRELISVRFKKYYLFDFPILEFAIGDFNHRRTYINSSDFASSEFCELKSISSITTPKIQNPFIANSDFIQYRKGFFVSCSIISSQFRIFMGKFIGVNVHIQKFLARRRKAAVLARRGGGGIPPPIPLLPPHPSGLVQEFRSKWVRATFRISHNSKLFNFFTGDKSECSPRREARVAKKFAKKNHRADNEKEEGLSKK